MPVTSQKNSFFCGVCLQITPLEFAVHAVFRHASECSLCAM